MSRCAFLVFAVAGLAAIAMPIPKTWSAQPDASPPTTGQLQPKSPVSDIGSPQPNAEADKAGVGLDTYSPLYFFYRPADALRSESNPLVATVEGRDIYLSAVGDAFKDLPEQVRQQQPFDLHYPSLLEGVINHSALVLEAQRLHLDDDPAVKRRIARAAELALENELLEQQVTKKVTEEAIRARYQQRYGDKAGIEELRLRAIAVKTQVEAQQILTDLGKGADFATLAKQKSIDPTGANGGDIGFVQRAQFPPEVAKAVFALSVGEISPSPVHNQYAWDVFKVEAPHDAGSDIRASA